MVCYLCQICEKTIDDDKETDSVRYPGIKVDSKLNSNSHVNAIATKLNRANVRDFVNANILKSIYYALFESHTNYACIIWGQNISTINRLYILQKRHLELSISKSVMFTPLLCFITLKLLKLQTKSRLGTVSL